MVVNLFNLAPPTTTMSDNFFWAPEDLETNLRDSMRREATHLHDPMGRLPPDISSSVYDNIDTNRPMYSDRLATTFNTEWSSDHWDYRPILGGPSDVPNRISHVAQSHTSSSAGLSGPSPYNAGTSAVLQTIPIYTIPTTSSTGAPHLQFDVPALSDTGGSYFNVSGSTVLSHNAAMLLGEDPQKHHGHPCDSGPFLTFSNELMLTHVF